MLQWKRIRTQRGDQGLRSVEPYRTAYRHSLQHCVLSATGTLRGDDVDVVSVISEWSTRVRNSIIACMLVYLLGTKLEIRALLLYCMQKS
jgi:hypothetical protein